MAGGIERYIYPPNKGRVMAKEDRLVTVSATIPESLRDKMVAKIDGIRYSSKSHFIKVAITRLLEKN